MRSSSDCSPSLRLSPPVTAGSAELVVVEKVSIHGDEWAASATLVPIAVVVRTGAAIWASDLDGSPVSLDPLLDEVTGLRAWVGDRA